jgi:hypothetical protein
MTLNIETVTPVERCAAGIVSQICGLAPLPQPQMDYMLGYQYRHVKEIIGDIVIDALTEQDITLGTEYGGAGIDPRILLTKDPDDNYYEICAKQLLELPWSKRKLKKLFSKHKMIISCLCEGGFYICRVLNELAEEIADARDIIYCYAVSTNNTGDWYNLDSIPVNKRIEIPHFIYGVGTYYQKNNFIDTDHNVVKKYLVPVHKARKWRVEVLATLEGNGILADSDWSLHHIAKDKKVSSNGFNSFGQRYRYSFLDSPGLDNILHETVNESSVANAFIDKHKDILPKSLHDSKPINFSDHMDLNITWKDYEWYIGLETHCDKFVITEKCLKGFALGVPSIIISDKNFNNYLSSFGFKIDGNYDYADTLAERVKLACDFIKNNKGDKDIVKHNYELLNNNEFLASLIVGPLVKLKRDM